MKKLIRILTRWAWLPVLEKDYQKLIEIERHNETLKSLVTDAQTWVNQERQETDLWRRRAERMREHIRERKGRQWVACRIRPTSW